MARWGFGISVGSLYSTRGSSVADHLAHGLTQLSVGSAEVDIEARAKVPRATADAKRKESSRLRGSLKLRKDDVVAKRFGGWSHGEV